MQDHLASALLQLNDLEQLGANPLAERLLPQASDAPGIGRAAQLRDLLVAMIESLKPADDVQPNSPEWRQYTILRERYVLRRPMWQIEQKLTLGDRQVRREHRRALSRLAACVIRKTPGEVGVDVDVDANLNKNISPQSAADLSTLQDAVQRLTPQPRVFGLRDLVSDVAGIHADIQGASAAPSGVSWRVEPDDLTAYADRGILHQLLMKLLQLASAHARSGAIVMEAAPADRGIGITLTAELSPAHASDDGLRLCEWLAESLQTRLEIGAGPGAQVMFSLSLPAGTALRRVLIIDDEAMAADLFESYLAGLDYQVATVTRPEEALRAAARARPDVIVLDVMMPGVDGWELLQRIRHAPELEAVPVVVCSVLKDADLAEALGAAAFINKPVLRQPFIAALETALARRTARPAPR
jgi:CheY-like chemotaxis protein